MSRLKIGFFSPDDTALVADQIHVCVMKSSDHETVVFGNYGVAINLKSAELSVAEYVVELFGIVSEPSLTQRCW